MTAKMIPPRKLNLIWSETMESRIRNAQSSRMWALLQMFLDWFSLHSSPRNLLRRCWWWSMQLKQEGTRERRKSRIECVNYSPASLCILTECFSSRYIMGGWWAVACEYRLITRCIVGAKKLLARHMNFSPVRVNRARILLCSALPQGQVLIWQKD